MIRGGTRSPSSITAIDSSARSTVSRGTSATPTPRRRAPARCRCRRSGRRPPARAGQPQTFLDALGRAACAIADERQVEDLAERRDFLPLRERRVGGRDEHVWVAHQLDRLERPALERKHAEADVDVAALHELEQLEVVVRLHEPDVDVRPLVAKRARAARGGRAHRPTGTCRCGAARSRRGRRRRGRPEPLPGAR